jgi:hypothetical protein
MCCGSDSVFSLRSGDGLVAVTSWRWALHGGGLLGVVTSVSLGPPSALGHVERSTTTFVWLVGGSCVCLVFVAGVEYSVEAVLVCSRPLSVTCVDVQSNRVSVVSCFFSLSFVFLPMVSQDCSLVFLLLYQ